MPVGIYQHKPNQGFKKGNRLGELNKGRRGQVPWNWKGENAEKPAIHIWVKSKKGKPMFCIDCGKVGKEIKGNWNIHWSNIDHKYRRVLEDYVGRCAMCHCLYDIIILGVKKGRKLYN